MLTTLISRQCVGVVLLASVVATGCGRVGGRVARSAASQTAARVGTLFARDAVRDRSTRAVSLAADRRVFRYTTAMNRRLEVRQGFHAGTHFTSRATAGRPPSAATASARLGLPMPPSRRLSVTLPKGTPVRFNKALGGSRGVGEIAIARRLAPNTIKRSVRIR
jgi:hypothetical protein